MTAKDKNKEEEVYKLNDDGEVTVVRLVFLEDNDNTKGKGTSVLDQRLIREKNQAGYPALTSCTL